MLCPKCGFYSEAEESVCPECGTILGQADAVSREGVEAIRQGKRAREAAAKRPAPTGVNGEEATGNADRGRRAMPFVRDTRGTEEETSGSSAEEQHPVFERRGHTYYDDNADETLSERYSAYYATGTKPRHLVNWMKFAILAVAAAALLLGGGWLFLMKTNAGQILLARMGKDASSMAYWSVGDERMNHGDVDGAIEAFQKARKKDEEEGVVDVDGLLMLGSALEAADRTDEAADLYEEIYTQTPSRTEAYVNHIRILLNSDVPGDKAKAGDLMKLAYDKTGETTFLTQRNDLLPSPPEAKPTAAYYETKKTLILTSYQGYDVYYVYNNEEAVLPDDGILATKEGFMMDEGIYNVRAVAVYNGLVSDEMRGTWKIIMPSPQTPRATLAPNTYKRSQTVRLKPGLDDEKDTSIVIYYTVDGSIPDADSPIFDGEPIQLPNGWVTLKAYAVNRYRKLSNMLEVKYKIEANPKPKSAFSAEDTIGKVKIFQTTLPEFNAEYGEGTLTGSEEREGFDSECRRYEYSWGYIETTLVKKNWVITEISIRTDGNIAGPRGTRVGNTEAQVVDQFRDMGQVASRSGNRGLYATDSGSTGKIWVQENGEKIIRYRYPVDSRWVQLDYLVSASGTVKNINLKYIPLP